MPVFRAIMKEQTTAFYVRDHLMATDAKAAEELALNDTFSPDHLPPGWRKCPSASCLSIESVEKIDDTA